MTFRITVNFSKIKLVASYSILIMSPLPTIRFAIQTLLQVSLVSSPLLSDPRDREIITFHYLSN